MPIKHRNTHFIPQIHGYKTPITCTQKRRGEAYCRRYERWWHLWDGSLAHHEMLVKVCPMCRVQTRHYESQEDNACHKSEFGRMVKGGNERRTKEKGRIDNHTNANAQKRPTIAPKESPLRTWPPVVCHCLAQPKRSFLRFSLLSSQTLYQCAYIIYIV